MSMNIFISAEREIVVPKNGRRDTQYAKFQAWQTPTDETYKILEAEDPLQAYRDWVMQVSHPEVVPIYADDDLFGECDPIDHTTIHPGEEHIEELKLWLEQMEEGGYEVKVSLL